VLAYKCEEEEEEEEEDDDPPPASEVIPNPRPRAPLHTCYGRVKKKIEIIIITFFLWEMILVVWMDDEKKNYPEIC
jgi:hypothetical protein